MLAYNILRYIGQKGLLGGCVSGAPYGQEKEDKDGGPGSDLHGMSGDKKWQTFPADLPVRGTQTGV